jgi:hypothetical protein
VITDPFARAAGNILSDKPVAFFRGRQGNAARGLWEVTNPEGGRVGYYLADFTRGGDWRLLRLELIPAGSPAPEVKPFCAIAGDIEAFHRAAAAMPESEIASRSKKSKPLATCLDGPDCSGKWARARQWLAKYSLFPLIRDTDALLMTSGPLYPGNLQMAYAVVLDPATSGGQRTIRFRAWCANWVACSPSLSDARRDFLAALQEGTVQSP